jgi:NAD(P)H-flavin reductase
MTSNGHNPMLPYFGRLEKVVDMAPEIKLFEVRMLNGGGEAFRAFEPGQFAFLSAFGVGEAPFGIASTPNPDGLLQFAVQRLGSVTTEMHELGEGDLLGVRGPLGNHFPMAEFEGKNLLVLGGGIGGAPLRPVIQHVLAHRDDYGHLTILWAARKPELLLFTEDYDAWRATPDTELHLTVDEGGEGWEGEVGLITDLLRKVDPKSGNSVAITCGPPVMIYYADKVLAELGFPPERRYVTLEARMHCGIGKCGRCNIGEKLVCVDGPVFNMEQAAGFLEGYL